VSREGDDGQPVTAEEAAGWVGLVQDRRGPKTSSSPRHRIRENKDRGERAEGKTRLRPGSVAGGRKTGARQSDGKVRSVGIGRKPS